MAPTDDDLSNLRNIASQDAAATDAELANELKALKTASRSQLEALEPKLSTDPATFNKLLKAVDEATQNNENIEEFTNRLKTLGKGVLGVARTAASLLP